MALVGAALDRGHPHQMKLALSRHARRLQRLARPRQHILAALAGARAHTQTAATRDDTSAKVTAARESYSHGGGR